MKRKGKYQAAFIIPTDAKKILGEDGWEFETSNRVSPEVSEYLIKSLNLKLLESYLEIDDYVNEKMKMSVIHDDQKNIESIYLQLYEESVLDVLLEICQNSKISDGFELFVPGAVTTR
jgi:hypothetical protein